MALGALVAVATLQDAGDGGHGPREGAELAAERQHAVGERAQLRRSPAVPDATLRRQAVRPAQPGTSGARRRRCRCRQGPSLLPRGQVTQAPVRLAGEARSAAVSGGDCGGRLRRFGGRGAELACGDATDASSTVHSNFQS
ncbi:hypothetical protein ANANG_G00266620 [Anguilla anguilla]|uniref:Uncharacterized protein n=1 Tax=Anguilla anguilla TaxID=7936 RepID=A0A9D3RLT3_ANGAN|nr:hypothetical protein ANANG_G00266620 [Anguilla anguilla]